MSILLSDGEEIAEIAGRYMLDTSEHKLLKAQALKLWNHLNEPCSHGIGDFHDNEDAVTMCHRFSCPKCMAEIEQEFK